MSETRASTLSTVAPVVFSLLIGGLIGFFIRQYSITPSAAAAARTASQQGGSPGGGGGGRGGGGQPSSGQTLARLVGTLSNIEKAQNKGLTPDQEAKVLPILKEIQSADKLPEDEAKKRLDALNAVLTPDQQDVVKSLTPQRGGRGGGGGGGMMGGGMMGGGPPGGMSGGGSRMGGNSGGGMMAAGPPGGMSGGGPRSGMSGGGGMGGGGGQPDPEKPFASERAKQSLTDLISELQPTAKK